MKTPKYRISTLFWLLFVVCVFLAARSPVFDFLLDPSKGSREIKLQAGSQMSSRSHPEVIDISFPDLQTFIIHPKKPGLCLLEIRTFEGFEVFIVRVSPTYNVTVEPVIHENRVSTILKNGRTVNDYLDRGITRR